jgi:acetyl esterase/lipase
VPFGYLVTTTLAAVCTAFALAPPRPRRSSPSNRSFWLGYLFNELPFVAFYVLLASTALAIGQSDLNTPVGWIGLGAAALATAGLSVVAWRGLRAQPAVERALVEGLGAGWRSAVDPPPTPSRVPLPRILFAPFSVRRRDVERIADVQYGPAGKQNLLDVYRHRSRPSGAPVLVYLHGGAFRSGRKNREARPLLYRFASDGWVCVSANYRLGPAARFPDHLIDVKKVIAWVRQHGHRYGADPAVVVVAGSSAGGHLASMAALTPNEPAFQPGFEQADTSVTAVVSLYGYYGSLDTDAALPSSPLEYVGPGAPPFFLAHGDRDTIVIPEDARRFAERLRSVSSSPVVYAELPGGQHVFDLFNSLRFEAVVDGVEAFVAWVLAARRPVQKGRLNRSGRRRRATRRGP